MDTEVHFVSCLPVPAHPDHAIFSIRFPIRLCVSAVSLKAADLEVFVSNSPCRFLMALSRPAVSSVGPELHHVLYVPGAAAVPPPPTPPPPPPPPPPLCSEAALVALDLCCLYSAQARRASGPARRPERPDGAAVGRAASCTPARPRPCSDTCLPRSGCSCSA